MHYATNILRGENRDYTKEVWPVFSSRNFYSNKREMKQLQLRVQPADLTRQTQLRNMGRISTVAGNRKTPLRTVGANKTCSNIFLIVNIQINEQRMKITLIPLPQYHVHSSSRDLGTAPPCTRYLKLWIVATLDSLCISYTHGPRIKM